MNTLSARLLSFYGDDFTGSTDALEVVASAGIPAVLFLTTPDAAHLARFPEARVVGLAGISRSQDPAWMDEHLPPVFEWLKAIGATLCHYKVAPPSTARRTSAASAGLRRSVARCSARSPCRWWSARRRSAVSWCSATCSRPPPG